MLSLKNLSSKVPIVVTAASRDAQKPIKPPSDKRGLPIAPGETRKVPQPTCGGSCLTSIWSSNNLLLWQGVIPSSGAKDFEIDPETKTVTYEGTVIPPVAETNDSPPIEQFQADKEKKREHHSSGYSKWFWILLLLLILALLAGGYYYYSQKTPPHNPVLYID